MGRERLEEILRAPAGRGGSRLAAGGAYGLWMQTGHYEVMQEAAERFGFTSSAVAVMRVEAGATSSRVLDATVRPFSTSAAMCRSESLAPVHAPI